MHDNMAYIYKLYENMQEEGGIVWKRIHTGSIADSVHCIVTEFYSGTGVRQYSAGIYDRCGVCNYRHAVFFHGCRNVNVSYGGTCRRQHA